MQKFNAECGSYMIVRSFASQKETEPRITPMARMSQIEQSIVHMNMCTIHGWIMHIMRCRLWLFLFGESPQVVLCADVDCVADDGWCGTGFFVELWILGDDFGAVSSRFQDREGPFIE